MKNRSPAPEWIGGLVPFPAYVTGEGEPYKPEILLWAVPHGPVVGVTLEKSPGVLLARAAELFRETARKPMAGPPGIPSRVRVASQDLANALRKEIGSSVDVVCAPTPELEEVLDGMRDWLSKGADDEQSFLGPGVEPPAVASFFRAAAALFRAAPWRVVPGDEGVLLVTVEGLGVEDAAVSVIGQMGQSLGFVLFSTVDDFDAYLEAAEEAEQSGRPPRLPPHFALNFERGMDLSPAIRKEVARHEWEVAGPAAYPWPVAIDADLVARPPTARELAVLEAVARTLAQSMEERAALLRAWTAGERFSRSFQVTLAVGVVDVTLSAPRSGRSTGAPRDPSSRKNKSKARRRARNR